ATLRGFRRRSAEIAHSGTLRVRPVCSSVQGPTDDETVRPHRGRANRRIRLVLSAPGLRDGRAQGRAKRDVPGGAKGDAATQARARATRQHERKENWVNPTPIPRTVESRQARQRQRKDNDMRSRATRRVLVIAAGIALSLVLLAGGAVRQARSSTALAPAPHGWAG